MYREGMYEEALIYYTAALAAARTKPQKIALHSNRAACFLKLHQFRKATEECTSVLELDHKHTGALMLRAQTLVTLKEYNSALFDVNRLIELNPSSEVYHNLKACLRTQVTLTPIPESEAEFEEEEEEHEQSCTAQKGEEQYDSKEDIVLPAVREDPNVKESSEQEIDCKCVPEINTRVAAPQEPNSKGYPGIPKSDAHIEQKKVPQRIGVSVPIGQGTKDSKGWQAISKPKGHSALDYARWVKVQDDSSDDDEDDSQPRYRFRVRTVGMRPVK
ncbi:Cysteine-rich RLK (RECEPTOR-like protein kinase) 8 [Hibiscus syriacus]|uniref:Cysteine-rich RLK (RECEPTOR-like protein kinase) 8 n=2 Tax=Hibiscus syriacus TaxID=106335 RepID=A0A6A3BDD0_HIBSY|nr:Cysteine-rich RLK (RECEPTOR-like protein kinase) 8 [Hibiscus syriacus]